MVVCENLFSRAGPGSVRKFWLNFKKNFLIDNHNKNISIQPEWRALSLPPPFIMIAFNTLRSARHCYIFFQNFIQLDELDETSGA